MSLVDQLIGSAKPTSLLDRQGSAKLVKARVNCEPAARFPQRPTPSKRPRFQYLGALCTAKRLPVLSPSASRSVRSLLHAATEWSLSTTTDLPTRDRHHTRREFSHPKSVQLSSHHRWLQIEQAPNVGTWLATTFSYSRLLFYVRSNLQSLGSFSVLPNCQLLPASFWLSRFAAVRYYLCTGPCSVECSLTHSLIHALPSSQIKPWNSSPQVNLSLSFCHSVPSSPNSQARVGFGLYIAHLAGLPGQPACLRTYTTTITTANQSHLRCLSTFITSFTRL